MSKKNVKKIKSEVVKKEKAIEDIIKIIEGDMALCGSGSGSGSGATAVAGVRG